MNSETQTDASGVLSPKERAEIFAKWLQDLLCANDEPKVSTYKGENVRGVLAVLRSGLGTRNREWGPMWRYVAPYINETHHKTDDWFFVVAALAGWHPAERPSYLSKESLGKTARTLRDDSGSVDAHFAALLACREDDLPGHLRRIVGLLRSKDVPVDYRQLLMDLVDTGWSHPERLIQQKWARDFYWKTRDFAVGEVAPVSELSSDV